MVSILGFFLLYFLALKQRWAKQGNDGGTISKNWEKSIFLARGLGQKAPEGCEENTFSFSPVSPCPMLKPALAMKPHCYRVTTKNHRRKITALNRGIRKRAPVKRRVWRSPNSFLLFLLPLHLKEWQTGN